MLHGAISTNDDHDPGFWPFASAEVQASYDEPYGGWPECWGTCLAGACAIDKTEAGCCFISKRRFSGYAESYAEVEGSDDYKHKDKLICWKGTTAT